MRGTRGRRHGASAARTRNTWREASAADERRTADLDAGGVRVRHLSVVDEDTDEAPDGFLEHLDARGEPPTSEVERERC